VNLSAARRVHFSTLASQARRPDTTHMLTWIAAHILDAISGLGPLLLTTGRQFVPHLALAWLR
jgi:hypothetical protein